jgi:uncharacterized protein YkwD
LKISVASRRSVPLDGQSVVQTSSPPKKSRRLAALIVVALILLAAFVAVAPYLSKALKEGYSIFSQLTTTGPNVQTSTTGTGSTTNTTSTTGTPTVQCSSVVNVRPLTAPGIKNRSANITYPSDYCTLASYALDQINQDRAANGTGPVTLSYNQAAQQHSDSMLYYGYFSHFDTQGLKPYMRYSLLGGTGGDFENVAYFSYSLSHFTSTAAAEDAIKILERSMVYNDSACCNNGHKFNILNPLHNKVSIGVAYSDTYLYFDEEFENVYINLNFVATGANAPKPYYVTMTGAPTQQVKAPTSIYIAFDSTPMAQTPAQLNAGPREYGPGTLEGGVLPRNVLGQCAQFVSGTTVCADTWKFTSTQVDIEFSLQEFVKNYGTGVYTVYLITGSSTDSAITSISVFVG